MGYGDYSHAAHEAMTQARAHLPQQQVFTQSACHALMNPKGVRARESRDSQTHPRSIAIAFALDVTGSMGKIPDLLARQELPKFMRVLEECKVSDPQILFMAVGDATSDNAPLQVGQFESAAKEIDQWLTWSFLEGNGGGQNHESYELALYFLAQHTELDCFRKRQKKGYIFMTGDELPYPFVSRHQVDALVGDALDEDIPVADVVAAAQETFEPFFLIPDQARRSNCERAWRDLLGDHVICMNGPEDTCYVAAGAIALREGVVKDLDALAATLATAGANDRVGGIVTALAPYAATLGRDAAAQPKTTVATPPPGDGKSGVQRKR